MVFGTAVPAFYVVLQLPEEVVRELRLVLTAEDFYGHVGAWSASSAGGSDPPWSV